MKHQQKYALEDLIEAINKENSFNKKIQNNHCDSDHFILQDDHSDNYEYDSWTHFNNENNSENESYDELDNSQQLWYGVEYNNWSRGPSSTEQIIK